MRQPGPLVRPSLSSLGLLTGSNLLADPSLPAGAYGTRDSMAMGFSATRAV
jgi:hypothetical protein